jgi:hypothetical protein
MGTITRKKLSELRSLRSRTNWARVLSQSDEAIERAARHDRDARILSSEQIRRLRGVSTTHQPGGRRRT